jgi:hypothetical protein
VTAVAIGRPARFRPARVLRLEIKYSPIVWVLPVLAALFYFNTYGTAAGLPPTWANPASVITGTMLAYVCVFAAGLAAWVGTREGRRKTGDLLATTARAAWARQATVLAATAFWMVLAFLAETAVLYIQTASQATWGGPPLWPVAVGVVCVITACAIGFTGGTLFPGRFTAPIVAVAVFVLEFIGIKSANSTFDFSYSGADSTYALLVPDQGLPRLVEAGVFYHVPPDVSIAQVMFMGGALLVMGGLLCLSPAAREPGVRGLSFAATGRRLAVVAAAAVACGAAASVTAFSLAGTAQYTETTGWVIPALHDAAGDQPVPYTPDCTGTAFRVCIHPAYAGYLGAMTAALEPAAAEIAGLPGAPVRAELAVGDALPAAAGTTSVYAYSGGGEDVIGSWFTVTPAQASTPAWEQGDQQAFLFWFVSGSPRAALLGTPDPAQQAVADALLAKIGAPAPQLGPPQKAGAGQSASGASGPGSQASAAQISAAASSFGSLPPAARHAWLAANIAALRSGDITLARIP